MPDISQELDEIKNALSGITIDPASVALLKTQGFNSIACGIDASLGPAVLHINRRPSPEQHLQKVPEKIKAIADYLLPDSTIPTVRVYAVGHLKDGGYYILQNRISGETVGSQTIKDNEVVPIYVQTDSPRIMANAQVMFAHLHTKHATTRFGHMTVDETGALTAPYATWLEFIKEGSTRWISELKEAKFRDEVYNTLLAEALKHRTRLLEEYEDIFTWSEPCFVHGDLNPGNILAENGKITALLDFEWAVSGDPAWEFAFASTFPTEAYYQASGTSQESLEQRKWVYRFFWLLWGANVHVHNDDPFLCTWLLKKCIESTKKL